MSTTLSLPRARTRHIGPDDHGRKVPFGEFIRADFEEGWLYELARGVVVVTDVPNPDHGEIVDRITDLFVFYRRRHPGLIRYRAAGSDCRIRAPFMKSDRHPDQAVYLDPRPEGDEAVWTRWVPHIVVEVVSKGSHRRDYVEKAEEYLRIGVREYWVLDPAKKQMLVHLREGDTWHREIVPAGKTYKTTLLPGLVVKPGELLGLTSR